MCRGPGANVPFLEEQNLMVDKMSPEGENQVDNTQRYHNDFALS